MPSVAVSPVLDLLEGLVASRPNEVAVDDGTLALTFAELQARAEALGEALDRVLSPGADVLVCVRPSTVFVMLQVALLGRAHCIVQVPTGGALDLLTTVAASTETRSVIVEEAASVDESAFRVVLAISSQGHLESHYLADSNLRQGRSHMVASDLPASVVMCTSGTTGTPKLVEVSQRAFVYSAQSLQQVLGLSVADRPLHHLSIAQGPGFFLWAGLAAGACNLIAADCRSGELPEALVETRATALFTVSPGLWTFVERGLSAPDVPALRTLYYSSGPVAVKLKHALVESFGQRLVQDYGMSEVREPLTVLSRTDHVLGLLDEEILSSVGRPLHRERIRLREQEVEAHSPAMFTSYWKNPKLTRDSMVDGWYRTKDLGYFDRRGYLHLTGRVDRVARSGGVDIDLAEVEESIELLDEVVKAKVSAHPDERFGERVEADVEVRPGSSLEPDQLRAKLHAILDPRAIPREIRMVEAT